MQKLLDQINPTQYRRGTFSKHLVLLVAIFWLPCLGIAQSVKSIGLSPNSVVGGTSVTATVTLTAPAGPGGQLVSISSTQACAEVPASINVPATASTVQFSFSTIPVDATVVAAIVATIGDKNTSSALTVKAPKLTLISLSPSSVYGGLSMTGTVKISGPAPADGLTIDLTSGDPSIQVPASVSILTSGTFATFTATTIPVSATVVSTITASTPSGSSVAHVTVLAPIIKTLIFSPSSVNAGSPSTGTITLSSPAPAGGLTIALAADTGVVTVPGSSSVSADSTIATFMGTTNVNWSGVGTVTATLNGGTKSAKLTVKLVSGLAKSPWPKFRNSALNTGIGVGFGATSHVSWTFYCGNTVEASPTIGADGTIYVGSLDNNLYAIKPTGTLKWKYNTGDGIEGAATIGANGLAYVGTVGNGTSYLFAVNTVATGSAAPGTLSWKYPADFKVSSPPAVGADGTVYFGSEDANFYALNPNGTLKWQYPEPTVACAGIGSDNRVYVDSAYGLFAFTTQGTPLWTYSTGLTGASSPAIGSDGTIYFGVQQDGNLYAVNPNGSYKWRFPTAGQITSGPAISPVDGTIYFGSYDHNLYAVDSQGALKWAFTAGDQIGSSPAIGADGTIYFGADDGRCYAVSSAGALLWSYPTGGIRVNSPALGKDGTVYFSSWNGYLYAFK